MNETKQEKYTCAVPAGGAAFAGEEKDSKEPIHRKK